MHLPIQPLKPGAYISDSAKSAAKTLSTLGGANDIPVRDIEVVIQNAIEREKASTKTADKSSEFISTVDNLHSSIAVMLHDWRDGDFELPTLAKLHVLNIEKSYREVGKLLAQ